MYKQDYFRNKNYQSDRYNCSCHEQYSPCGYVFNLSDEVISLLTRIVAELLDSRIEGFGHEHCSYAQYDGTPFGARYTEEKAGRYHNDSGAKMELRIGLMPEKFDYTMPGIYKRPSSPLPITFDSHNYPCFRK